MEKKLEASGIILREMNSYGIKNCLRLTIGNNYENNFKLRMSTSCSELVGEKFIEFMKSLSAVRSRHVLRA